MERIELTQEECYCTLATFYTNILKKLMGNDYTEEAQCDCRYIRVTQTIRDKCYDYYKTEKNAQEFEVSMLICMSGPKADLEGEGYIAEVDDKFICIPEE